MQSLVPGQCGGNLRCGPKADPFRPDSSLTETGNHEGKSLWHPGYGKLNSFFDLYSAISDWVIVLRMFELSGVDWTPEINTISFEWRVNVFPQCIAIVFLTRWRRFPSFSFVSLQCFFVTFCWPIIGYTKSWYTGMSIENNAYRLRYSDFPQPTRFFRATFLDPISSLSWSLEQATTCFKIAIVSAALVNSEPYESQIKGVHRGRW